MATSTLKLNPDHDYDEQVKEFSAHLELVGWEINTIERNDDIVTFTGSIGSTGCDCEFKFDICYCDGSCGTNHIPSSLLNCVG